MRRRKSSPSPDLPHSDDSFVAAYPAETTEAFCGAHLRAFDYFGGVPREILYDNTKLVRYPTNDYSVPTEYGYREVPVKDWSARFLRCRRRHSPRIWRDGKNLQGCSSGGCAIRTGPWREFWRDDQHYQSPSRFRFITHPRARVAWEERGTAVPGWLLRYLYRPMVRPGI